MKTFWKIVFATLFAVGVDYYLSAFGEERSIAYNFIDIFVFFSALLAFKQVPKVPKRKLMIGANTFALLLSLALVIGKAVYDTNSISLLIAGVPQITITLISLTGFTVVISAVTYILFAALAKNESKLDAKLWKFFAHPKAFLMIWAVIFICWIPCFLAYYPGIWSYDIETQTGMAGGIYSRFHPPIHTLLWDLALRASQHINLPAYVFYAIPQMLVLSFAFACVIKYLIKREAKQLGDFVCTTVFCVKSNVGDFLAGNDKGCLLYNLFGTTDCGDTKPK